jgi:hypothetical protein
MNIVTEQVLEKLNLIKKGLESKFSPLELEVAKSVVGFGRCKGCSGDCQGGCSGNCDGTCIIQ